MCCVCLVSISPSVHSTQPDSAGIQCVILAGCLVTSQSTNPATIRPISMLRRLQVKVGGGWRGMGGWVERDGLSGIISCVQSVVLAIEVYVCMCVYVLCVCARINNN